MTTTTETTEVVKATLKEVGAFFGITSTELSREMRQMSPEDRTQLCVGIGNGTLTY